MWGRQGHAPSSMEHLGVTILSLHLSFCLCPYFHLCPYPSISGDRGPSLSSSILAPISPQPCPHPSLPPCVTPSPVPTLTPTPAPPGAVLGPTDCCRLLRSHRRRAGSPPSRSSDPRTRAAVRREHVGQVLGQPSPGGCHGVEDSQAHRHGVGQAGALTTHWLQERPDTKRLQ